VNRGDVVGNIKLLGSNFYIKTITKIDVTQKYVDWLHDPETNKYLEVRHNLPNLEEQKLFVDTYDQKSNFLFGIYSNDTKTMIGTISLSLNVAHQTASFGYLIGEKKYLGTTAGIDAACLLLDFAFDDLALYKVSGGAYVTNIGSLFNFKRMGFIKEGKRREELLQDGKRFDSVLFGILSTEWFQKRESIGYK